MKFTEDEVKRVVFGEHEDYKIITEIEGEARRWSQTNEVIVQNVNTNKMYSVQYEQGLTEMQDNYYEEQEASEVEPVTETIQRTVYKEVK